jgi:hypothetical protein
VSGAVQGGVRTSLRVEGLMLLAVSALGYQLLGLGWGLFALCFLAPDLAMLGYLAGQRFGALAYNLAHSLAGPLLLLAAGLVLGQRGLLGAALVWSAHIGFDRALGYGLKYASGFHHTHLGRIGRSR